MLRTLRTFGNRRLPQLASLFSGTSTSTLLTNFSTTSLPLVSAPSFAFFKTPLLSLGNFTRSYHNDHENIEHRMQTLLHDLSLLEGEERKLDKTKESIDISIAKYEQEITSTQNANRDLLVLDPTLDAEEPACTHPSDNKQHNQLIALYHNNKSKISVVKERIKELEKYLTPVDAKLAEVTGKIDAIKKEFAELEKALENNNNPSALKSTKP